MIALLKKILHGHGEITLRINEGVCTGCGKCVKICPQIFAMEDHLALIIDHAEPGQYKKACKKASEACAVGAIIIE